MPKPTPVYHLLRRLRWGWVNVENAAGELIDLAGEWDVAELVAQLPPEVLDSMRHMVAKAPKTEEEWERSIFILGCSAIDLEAARAAAKASYRRGVEALRRYYAIQE